MSSRRMITRSYSGDGRSGHVNGDDVSGSGRPSSRSYLSNVRPENSCSSHRYSQYRPPRSTLCTVMAQLTEETQPFFETTLKSKAVSENSNVKFTCVVTGYPTPEVIWYKDDMQLDRYCGLPKHEIFRNGQNYSLHIYNCTVEDAALYQASASNNKGIVSCSCVLEVGVMNEYKIHQRYFAKLKQKAENKRRELEGKENKEPPGQQQQLRTISPDRTQRKRRSPMEASFTTPRSMEDEGTEKSHPIPAAEAEARLKEAADGQTEERSIPITTRAVSPIMNGQAINENGSKSVTYTYDSVQKIFTSHQPKTPFVKKKIKISSVEESVKADIMAERMSEERKVDGEACIVLSPTESLQYQGSSEEVMEVMSTTDTLNSNSIKEIERHQKKATDEALPINIPSDDEKVCAEGHIELLAQGKQSTVPLYSLCPDIASSTVLHSTNHYLSGTESKKVAELEKEAGRCDAEENSGLYGPSPPVTSTQPSSTPVATAHQSLSNIAEEDVIKMQQEDITAMEVEAKPNATECQLQTAVPPAHETGDMAVDLAKHNTQCFNTAGPIHHASPVHSSLESADTPCETVAASLQPKHEQSSDQLSETETSNDGLKNASVSQPPLQGEVTQAHTRTNRNDAPVNLEPQPTLCTTDDQLPLKTPSERETATDDNQTATLRNPVQAAFDKMTQDTWDHSRGSSESHTVLFTDVQKSPLESPGDEENTPGCNISPTVQQSQVEKAIKTVMQTEIKVDKKAESNEGGTLEIQGDNLYPNERKVEMETEVLSLKLGEQAEIERTMNAGEKQTVNATIEHVACDEFEKKETVMKKAEETHPESQNLKLTRSETTSPHVTNNPEKTRIQNSNKSEQYIKDFREIPKPVSKVISIAELLRSQMKALDVTGGQSVTTKSPNPDGNLFPTTNETEVTTEKRSELRTENRDRTLEVEKSKTDRHTEESSLSTAEIVSNPEDSPLLRERNGTPPIPSATPQELASGARRKIFIPKSKTEDSEATSPADNQSQKEEGPSKSSNLSPGSVMLSASPTLSRRSSVLQPSGPRTPPPERRSPLFNRRKVAQDPPTPSQEPNQQIVTLKTEEKTVEKNKHNPFKAPQVIRKIRGESFSDASGHLKLWCQFFNVLSDSTLKWCRDEVEIAQVKRSAGDETQVNLAIVQASSRDCGVYGCTITNEHGTDSTDFLLSADILAGMSLREDLGVGEEIEMTPLLLNKGLADSGVWGNKFFGRVMMQESRIGEGCTHKVWRAKVIYGLEPVFESGTTCIIKVCSPITYAGKQETHLVEMNMGITQRVCRIQNLAREYCKVFSAEARVIENFGKSLEVIPVYLMYRPANTIPHATVETDLKGVYLKYSRLDDTGRLVMRTASEVEQKCCALQHWIHQWTNGNLLLTRMEGVDTKITNVGISIKSTGYQGLSVTGNPEVFEQFVSQHQCNYYCGLLSLRSLKAMDSLQMPSKPKGSRSPLLQRKMASGSSSPQSSRKAAVSPRMPRKSESEHDSSKAPTKQITDKRSLR
ncbi:alpha-protein kinase 3 [Lampris incognitus]|uniref:alpha-protein kinase 3 n=1 Tax=Lampris incognitus TaxID=2546036 RepID=UPI0024B59506|nr:alpha-protein kinase 3 [Lampris incognitus]